ncbi:hypothetical protein M1D72_14855 [Vibrio sp. AK197]
MLKNIPMIRKYIILFVVFFISNNALSKEVTLDNLKVNIFEQSVTDENYPLLLKSKDNGKEYIVDRFPYEGAEPKIDDIQLTSIKDQFYLIVQVSWTIRHSDINGTQYTNYIYKYTNGRFTKDIPLTNTKAMSGFTGYEDPKNPQKYQYQDLNILIKYLKDKIENRSVGLCSLNENTLFSCQLNNEKLVSICGGSKNKIYRYGTTSNIEISYPKWDEKNIKHNESGDFIFSRGGYTYSLKANNKFKPSLLVTLNNKTIFNKSCSEVY